MSAKSERANARPTLESATTDAVEDEAAALERLIVQGFDERMAVFQVPADEVARLRPGVVAQARGVAASLRAEQAARSRT